MSEQAIIQGTLPDISEKSKKNEILDAYHALLNKIKETRPENIQVQGEKKKKQEDEIVGKASTMTLERIINNLASTKIMVGQTLDNLEQRLVEEHRKFNELQAATKIEAVNLEELHNIKQDADSLAALLLAQKEKRELFEQEMINFRKNFEDEKKEARDEWDKEQESRLLEQKEKDQAAKRDRLREEEEYRYTLQLERKKDLDTYQTTKQSLEKELTEKRENVLKDLEERQIAIKASEEEFKNLKIQAQKFPQELAASVQEAEKTVRETLENQYKHQIELSSKEIDGERKLSQQIIASLQSKIKEQEVLIKQLSQKADEATVQVQSIAIKALEGSTPARYYGSYEESKKQAA